MDVDGYIFRIKQAMILEEPEKGEKIWLVKHVSLRSLQKAFAPHESWHELNDGESPFVKFLNDIALEENGKYSVFVLRVICILWCEGSAKEKTTEFYENL